MSAITSTKVNTWNTPPSTHTDEWWKQQLQHFKFMLQQTTSLH